MKETRHHNFFERGPAMHKVQGQISLLALSHMHADKHFYNSSTPAAELASKIARDRWECVIWGCFVFDFTAGRACQDNKLQYDCEALNKNPVQPVFFLSLLWTVTLRSRKRSGKRSHTSLPSQSPLLLQRQLLSSSRCHGNKTPGRQPPLDSSLHPWRYWCYYELVWTVTNALKLKGCSKISPKCTQISVNMLLLHKSLLMTVFSVFSSLGLLVLPPADSSERSHLPALQS